jgi:hypothetical protein
MAAPEAKGKWSIRHVVQHLADSELVWGYRLRKVLGEDRVVSHNSTERRRIRILAVGVDSRPG